MKAVGLYRFGGPEVLQVVDRPHPGAPGRDEIGIEVHAASVNPADFYVRDGRLAGPLSALEPPWIPGIEVAGIVRAVGADATARFRIGDSVAAHVMPLTARGGGYAQHVVPLARWATRMPAGVSVAAAATLPMNGMTALDAVEKAGAQSDAVIAITGGPGAVGGYAIELAKAAGARVVTDADPKDEDLVRALGADVVVPRGDASAWRAATHRQSLDGVVDTVGAGSLLLPLVRSGGAFAQVAAAPPPDAVREALAREIAIHAVNVTRIPDSERMLEQLRGRLDAGRITLRVAAVLAPGDAARAHEMLAAGGVRGRLVLDFSC